MKQRNTINALLTAFFAMVFLLGVGLSTTSAQGSENFDNSEATASYLDGSFVGNGGITWTYGHSRNEGDFAIDGHGIMLRRASDSFLEATIPGGIGDFSFQYRKAFAGTAIRQLELIVNGVQVAVGTEFGTAEPDPTIYTFTASNINTAGNVTVRIKNVGTTSTNRQTVIDNISWTGFVSADPVLTSSISSLTELNYVEGAGPSAPQSFSLSGLNLNGSDVTVTAPSDFMVSTSESTGFATSVTLESYDGSAQTIYTRLVSGLGVETYSGDISITGGGAPAISISLTGEVTEPPPSLTAFDSPYTQNFSTFESSETIPNGWQVSNTTYVDDWGEGVGAGLRGNSNVLGFQHTAGTGVFTITLTLVNGTGESINSLDIGYLGKVERATEGRSPEWTVNVSGTAVPQLSYSTAVGVDATRNSVVSGLDIPDGDSFTITWSSERGGGSGSSRQIGISDVSVKAIEVQVEVPVINLAAGTYFENQNVTISNFGDYPSGTSIYFTLDGNDPTSGSSLYDNSTGIELVDGNGPITLKAIAIDDSERESPIAERTFTFPVNVADIQILRGQTTGSTIYRVNNQATLTGKTEFRNTKFFQDDSGFAIQIDDNGGVIETSYEVGDNVQALIGTLSTSPQGQLQLVPSIDFGAAVSSGNFIVPVVRTLDGLTDDDQARLVLINNVEFQSPETSFGGGGSTRSITDPSLAGFTGVFRNIFAEGISGNIPAGSVNIIGVVQKITEGLSIGARDIIDIDPVDKSVELTGVEGWRILSSPVSGKTYADLLSGNVFTQCMTGADVTGGNCGTGGVGPNVFTFNTETNSYVALNDLDTVIPDGSAFLVYVYENDTPGGDITGNLNRTISINGPQFGENFSPSVNSELDTDRFTLLGNPYNANINFNQLVRSGVQDVVYVWDVNDGSGNVGSGNNTGNVGAGSWKSNAAGIGNFDGKIAPFQGFFIENEEEGVGTPSINFRKAARTRTSATFFGKEVSRELVQIRVQNDQMQNTMWLWFSSEGDFARTTGDALQLNPLSTHYAMIAAAPGVDSRLFDIKHVPIPGQDFELPIHFDATLPGEYTLSVSDFSLSSSSVLYFHDSETGSMIPFNDSFTYTFTHEVTLRINPDPVARLNSGLMAKSVDDGHRFSLVGPGFTPTSVEAASDLPTELVLSQNYPNPFNPTSRIDYQLPEASHVRLSVFDLLGREVAVLVNESMSAGSHFVNIHASNLSSGVYVYRLQAGGQVITRKMTLVK